MDLISGCAQAGIDACVYDLREDWDILHSARCADGLAGAQASREFTSKIRALLQSHRPDWTMAMWGNMLSMLTHTLIELSPQSEHSQQLTLPTATLSAHPAPFNSPSPSAVVRTIFDELSIPHVCYWLDAPHWAQGGGIARTLHLPLYASPSLVHITNNESTAAEMKQVLGFPRTTALPYGVRPTPKPEERTKCFDVVVSLGPGDPAPSPEALAQLKLDDPDISAVRSAAAQHALRKLLKPATQGGENISLTAPFARRLIDTQLHHRHRPMLDRIVALRPAFGTEVNLLLGNPAHYIRTTTLVRSIELAERAFTVCWLSKRFSIATFGGGDLAALGWPSRAMHLGELNYDAMPTAYASAPIGLNVMRWQDDSGVNLKPLEITASGAACLTSARHGLEDLFEVGSEIEQFDSPQQAAGMIAAMLGDAPGRIEMARAGHQRTLSDHTWCERASALAAAAMSASPTRPPVSFPVEAAEPENRSRDVARTLAS